MVSPFDRWNIKSSRGQDTVLKGIIRGVKELIQPDELRNRLEWSVANNKPLVVKEGFDPTAPDIHIGNMVSIRKLRTFQELGHRVVFLIGDYTGLVGDPSGQDRARKQMTKEEVLANAETYKQQIFKVLDPEKTEIRFNSEWFEGMSFSQVLELTSRYTVARILERDDFEKRYKAGNPISVMEFLYPLMQGYDSVALQSDIEIGGTDQKFNLLVGRALQERYGQKPQVVMTLPLLVGTDGVEKMSKSLGNYIGINESPQEIYGKTMSIPDNLIYDYFVLTTEVSDKKLKEVKAQLDSGSVNPMELKKQLAFELVAIYHNKSEAEKAQEDFRLKFSKKEIPEDIPELLISSDEPLIWIVKVIVASNVVSSNSAAMRLIKGGGVQLNGVRIIDKDYKVNLAQDNVIKIGKKNFLKIKWNK
ncbi:MAG: tyrosine--tRNA ligase [candidate division Zixibacteria bacterium 4484_95]|nr:MAG: tyrosine--tRNA ligase [candidate division Zixibacteria bacterium 4484_95]